MQATIHAANISMNCRRRRFMPRASAWIVAGDNSCRATIHAVTTHNPMCCMYYQSMSVRSSILVVVFPSRTCSLFIRLSYSPHNSSTHNPLIFVIKKSVRSFIGPSSSLSNRLSCNREIVKAIKPVCSSVSSVFVTFLEVSKLLMATWWKLLQFNNKINKHFDNFSTRKYNI